MVPYKKRLTVLKCACNTQFISIVLVLSQLVDFTCSLLMLEKVEFYYYKVMVCLLPWQRTVTFLPKIKCGLWKHSIFSQARNSLFVCTSLNFPSISSKFLFWNVSDYRKIVRMVQYTPVCTPLHLDRQLSIYCPVCFFLLSQTQAHAYLVFAESFKIKLWSCDSAINTSGSVS